MEKMTLTQAIEVYKGCNKEFYWLDTMVKQGAISQKDAGIIILLEG